MYATIRLAALAFLTGSFLLPIPTLAQTAEETVLFMLFGGEEPSAKKLAQNEWMLPKTDRREIKLQVKIAQLDNCRYRIYIGDQSDLLQEATFNFNNLQEFEVWEAGKMTVGFLGGNNLFTMKTTDSSSKIQEVIGHAFPVSSSASADRHRRAIAFFQNAYCRGRAF